MIEEAYMRRVYTSVVFLFALAIAANAQNSREAMASSYIERGNIWMARGEYDKAIADYDLAIASAPSAADGYRSRAIARYRKADLDGAFADFDRVVQLRP